MSTQKPSIAIIGAGIIGLSCSWELAKRGASVSIFDRGPPGHAASYAAAGMLAAGYEAAVESQAHARLFELCQSSASLWPTFASTLLVESGHDIYFQTGETLAVATDELSVAALMTSFDRLQAQGIDSEILSSDELMALEPAISRDVTTGIRLPNDGQVDNRAVITALLAACHKHGVIVAPDTPVERVDRAQFDVILWSVGADERMEAFGISPVKGAAYSVEPGTYLPSRIVRFGNYYIVPKKDRAIIGATIEPGVRERKPDEVLLNDLKARAAEICPGIEGAAMISKWSGLRPATRDHAPLLGKISSKEFIASGHHRSGILLAPVTANIMADMILDGKISELAAAFSPNRLVAASP